MTIRKVMGNSPLLRAADLRLILEVPMNETIGDVIAGAMIFLVWFLFMSL